MQMEERRSKGGFLQFFDWNSKSRKKLFSNGSDLPGGAKQGTKESELLAKSRIMNAADGSEASPSNKGSKDWNYASSETSNDGYESRAPGVVARLMGLDSLPSSSVTDQTSTSSDGFHPNKVSHDRLSDKYDSIDYLSSSRQLPGFPSTVVEEKTKRLPNRPIDRFQTEVLPPKSAKPISASHHKLFSPIRSPGIFPTKNPEYIIEAAAKILEANPRVTASRVTSSVSVSVPLRIQDLKAKLEAAYEVSKIQTPHEPNSRRNVERKPLDKDCCGSEDPRDSQSAVPLRKANLDGVRYKDKSPTNAKQAKAGVKRREERSQTAPRNVSKSREHNEGNSNRIPRRQPGLHRASQRKDSVNNRATVLQQNNQKQNITTGPFSTFKGSESNLQLVRAHSANGYKTVNKTNVKHGNNNMKKPPNSRNSYSLSRANQVSLNKGSSAMDSQRMRTVATNILVSNDVVSRGMNDNKRGMDVISFTFNSPIKKFSRDLLSDGQDCLGAASNVDNPKPSLRGSTSSSSSQSVINGNSLSILLEQKLSELTNRIEPPDFETQAPESSCSSTQCLEETVPSSVGSRGPSADHEKGIQEVSDNIRSFVCRSVEAVSSDQEQMPNADRSRNMGGNRTTAASSAMGKEVDFQQPSPVSILETSFESGSPDGISTNDDSRDCSSSSPQDQDMFKWLCAKEFPTPDDQSEFSNSTRSSFSMELDSKLARSCSMCSDISGNWELAYIGDIISNIGPIVTEILLVPRKESEHPTRFEELEDWVNGMGKYRDKPKDRRKILFDCATECVESRCRHAFTGTDRSWRECTGMLERERRLADEVYGEITSTGEARVDELLDSDMTSRRGKWIEFNAEVIEEGVKIGKGILATLMEELVTDLF
ncbi:hypothetical protein MLD38_035872 [Melastoma candidum]|uniref:Uncharacterized protein n=1 Tax=Melastoma candidum TaxID=119954 RepID=A0ACB9LHY2_9MYRT|nr:hypothetical protein MLD38_035872 [Melastoma candidum]